MARPEGLEPPTYRFEEASETYAHGLGWKKYSIYRDFSNLSSVLVPTLSAESGH